MPLVAGVDSSTQSCKVVVRDAATGERVRTGYAPHPEGTEVDPESWWAALLSAIERAGGLADVAARSIAGQQHGMVCLDAAGEPVRPALLWNDTRSADAAADLVEERGGPAAWADAVGVVPVAALTVCKLRWLARAEPPASATSHPPRAPTGKTCCRPRSAPPRCCRPCLARPMPRASTIGPSTGSGVLVGPGTGDNMAAALGVEAGPGDVVVSVGTSGTVFATAERPSAEPSGLVAGFADATALSGAAAPPNWQPGAGRLFDAAAVPAVRDHYSQARAKVLAAGS